MKRVLNFLVNPFTRDGWYLFILWLLSALAAVVFFLERNGFVCAVNSAAMGLVVSYAVVLLCNALGRMREPAMVFFAVLGVFNCLADKGSFDICQQWFSDDTYAIILGSNPSETMEFLGMFFSSDIFQFLILTMAACLVVYLFRRRLAAFLSRTAVTAFSVFVFAALVSFTFISDNYLDWGSVYVLKTAIAVRNGKPKDLALYRKNPDVSISGTRPDDVYVVIGESMCRNHCSIYGYEKNTMPGLLELAEKDSLVVFKDVTSAYTETVQCFKMILGGCDAPDEKDWYDRLTVFDILKSGGYRTEWLSNQSRSGFFDNVVASYAGLCDSTVWMGQNFKGMEKMDHDDILVDRLAELSVREPSDTLPKVHFVHMMGCHYEFSKRYPADAAVFAPEQYASVPESQRLNYCEYDNAIHYQDSLLCSFIKTVEATDGIMFFFPDHALDFYDTDPGYCGHGRPGDITSHTFASRIPMFVFGSTDFRERFPEKYEYLKSLAGTSFNTKDFKDVLCEICSIKNLSSGHATTAVPL